MYKFNWKTLNGKFGLPLAFIAFGLGLLCDYMDEKEKDERFRAIEAKVGINYDKD